MTNEVSRRPAGIYGPCSTTRSRSALNRFSIDPWPRGGEHQKLSRGHKGPERLVERTYFRHGHAIASDDEALASGDTLDHLGVVVPELSLRDGLCHELIEAHRATDN